MHPSILIDGQPPQPPFKFSIFCAGFTNYLNPLFKPITAGQKIWTPTLHVAGREDTFFIDNPKAKPLVEFCIDPRVHGHYKGHVIPSDPESIEVFKDFISFHKSSESAIEMVGVRSSVVAPIKAVSKL
ncbi:hypothetical protein FRB94_012401 [Tulasnella sp. JGI-2019a]|nr:hypothetical protein FRB94_012401 [Tulasnella sp. JGI-2019a]KAG9038335.1 hypothetical protein FRB95_001747 [Tulasnella sp. JGI-2019a]